VARFRFSHRAEADLFNIGLYKTPVWSREDAKTLLDSIPKDSMSGLRDPAQRAQAIRR
jgi:hypothetical protein